MVLPKISRKKHIVPVAKAKPEKVPVKTVLSKSDAPKISGVIKANVTGNYIHKFRTDAGLTQEEMASLMHVHVRTLQRLEDQGDQPIDYANACVVLLTQFDYAERKRLPHLAPLWLIVSGATLNSRMRG